MNKIIPDFTFYSLKICAKSVFAAALIKCDPVYEKEAYSLSKYPSLIIHNSWSSKAITL